MILITTSISGWNDPMNLSKFEPTGKLKINLNKRVAFPLNNKSTTESGSSQEPLRELPTIASNIGGEQTSNSSDDKSNVEEIFDTQAARKRVFSTLEESINQLKDSTVQSNVRAKLKNLENEWDSCDVELQKLLVQLVECKCKIIWDDHKIN